MDYHQHESASGCTWSLGPSTVNLLRHFYIAWHTRWNIQQNVAETKSQGVNTRENVAGTCWSDSFHCAKVEPVAATCPCYKFLYNLCSFEWGLKLVHLVKSMFRAFADPRCYFVSVTFCCNMFQQHVLSCVSTLMLTEKSAYWSCIEEMYISCIVPFMIWIGLFSCRFSLCCLVRCIPCPRLLI